LRVLLALNNMTAHEQKGIQIEGKRKKGKRKKGKRKERKRKNGKPKCSRKKGKRKIGKLRYRICPRIILSSGLFYILFYIVCIYFYTLYLYTRAEHAMPRFTAGFQSSPFPYTSLLWRTGIVAGSAASSASIYNVIQTEGFLYPRRVSNRRFHASQYSCWFSRRRSQ